MSRKFSFTVPYAVPVEELHRALTGDALWHARFADAETATLDLTHPDGPSTIRIQMTETAPQEKIPTVVKKVLSSDLTLSRTDNWQAMEGEIAKGTFEGKSTGISSEMSGVYEMRSTAEGSEIEVVGTVKVNVPLVGSVIEPLAEQLHHKVLTSERKFIEEWFATQSAA